MFSNFVIPQLILNIFLMFFFTNKFFGNLVAKLNFNFISSKKNFNKKIIFLTSILSINLFIFQIKLLKKQ